MSVSAMISPQNVPCARPPRVRNHPPYTWSAGPETVALAKTAGLVADDWQELMITDQLGHRDDGKFAAVECGDAVPRQNGKGVVIELRKIGGLFLLGERLVLYTAHQFKTAQEHFRRMKEYIKNSDEMSRQVKRISEANGEEGIELFGEGRHRLTGTRRLLYLARSKGSGRGFTSDGCLILDEAQYLVAKQLSALVPTLSALTVLGNPQLVYHGTPPDPQESQDGGAYWISVRNRGCAGVGRICWHEYSPEPGYPRSKDKPDGFDRTDREVWRFTNPALGIRISEEYVETVELDALTGSGTPEVFDRERLGVWPPDPTEGWRVIGKDDWNNAADPDSQVEDPVAFAIAVNPARTWATISVAGRRKDGKRHVESVDRRPGTAWLVPRVAALKAKWKPCAVMVRSSGPAGSEIADLEAAGIEVTRMSTQDYAKACGDFFDGICGKPAPQMPDEDEAPPDPRDVKWTGKREYAEALTAAVQNAAKRETGDVWVFESEIDADPTPLESAACALFGHAVFGHTAASAFNPGVLVL